MNGGVGVMDAGVYGFDEMPAASIRICGVHLIAVSDRRRARGAACPSWSRASAAASATTTVRALVIVRAS
eukprot:6175348-Pleurochrysis_carterae.AAC.2